MRFLSLSALALSTLLLTACGGTLDGSDDSTDTTTDSTTTTAVETDTTVPIVESVAGDPSYFSFEGVSSDWITIKGVGAEGTEETATVSFKIVDANGVAIEGEVVTFELLASPEGTSISVDTATSDEDGLVSTLIKSGVVAGPVVVKVVLVSDTDIYKTSNQLNISTGYPDQDSFTLAAETLAPEALGYIVSDVITVYLGGGEDNTAIPDGTTVNFTTTSGRITDTTGTKGYCLTEGSECSMEWKSTQPHASNGRAIITATAIGEESFIDSVDDGLYTEGEFFTDTNGDSKYTGYLCPASGDGDYCIRELITITKSIQVIIGGSEFSCDFKDATGTLISNVDLTTATGSASVTFTVSVYDDTYSNTPPKDTSISSSIENGVLVGDINSWDVTDSVDSTFDFDVTLKRETTANGVLTGNATFLVTSPNGIKSTCSIPVSDDA